MFKKHLCNKKNKFNFNVFYFNSINVFLLGLGMSGQFQSGGFLHPQFGHRARSRGGHQEEDEGDLRSLRRLRSGQRSGRHGQREPAVDREDQRPIPASRPPQEIAVQSHVVHPVQRRPVALVDVSHSRTKYHSSQNLLHHRKFTIISLIFLNC